MHCMILKLSALLLFLFLLLPLRVCAVRDKTDKCTIRKIAYIYIICYCVVI